MIIIALAAATLVIFGGYVATLKADFLQGLIMIAGVIALIVVVFRSQQVGGLAEGLRSIVAETKALELDAQAHIGLWATVLMTSFGTWRLPQMVHKYYGIKDKAEVKRGIVISTLFALIIAGGGYLIGSLSHLFFTELPEKGTDYLVPEYAGHGRSAEYSARRRARASDLCLCFHTGFDHHHGLDHADNGLPAGQALQANASGTGGLLAKVVSAAFIAVSYLIANTDTPILDMMSYSWGMISGSFMAPYMISLYWRRLSRAGAWAGMLGGFLTACPPVVCKLFFPDATTAFGKVAIGPHFACLAMLVSIVLCLLVSLVKPSDGTESGFYAQPAAARKGKADKRREKQYLEPRNGMHVPPRYGGPAT